MLKIAIGFIVGLIVGTVGVEGTAHLITKGINTATPIVASQVAHAQTVIKDNAK